MLPRAYWPTIRIASLPLMIDPLTKFEASVDGFLMTGPLVLVSQFIADIVHGISFFVY